jgi:CspA family cold shock protein
MREKGKIKTYFSERGFGFIRRAGCADVFFHVKDVETENPETVFEGAEVEFEVVQTERGLRAMDVAVLL